MDRVEGFLDPTSVSEGERKPVHARRSWVVAAAKGAGALVVVPVSVGIVLVTIRLLFVAGSSIVHALEGDTVRHVPFNAALEFSKRVDECAWLFDRLPLWLGLVGVGLLTLGAFSLLLSIGDLLGDLIALLAYSGTNLTLAAVLAKTSVFDLVVTLVSHPLRRRGEAIARLLGICLYVTLGILWILKTSPGRMGDLEIFPDTFSILRSMWSAVLPGFWLMVPAFLLLQIVFDTGEVFILLRASRSTITPWTAPSSELVEDGTPSSLSICHWSDLHLTETDETRRTEEGVGGNVALRELVARHAKDLAACDAIAVTGDLTDTGSSAEWGVFLSMAKPYLDRMFIVPGNHDLNIVHARNRFAVESPNRAGRVYRQIRMLAALDLVQGARSTIIVDGKRVGLREYLAGRRDALRAYYATGSEDRIADVEQCWDQCFPMAVQLPHDFVAYVFDSNDMNATMATNALGRVSKGAMARFQVLTEDTAPARQNHRAASSPRLPRWDPGAQPLRSHEDSLHGASQCPRVRCGVGAASSGGRPPWPPSHRLCRRRGSRHRGGFGGLDDPGGSTSRRKRPSTSDVQTPHDHAPR